MIRRLRWRFVRIAMVAVALVMVLLSLTVNIANAISVTVSLDQMLTAIADNRGKIPPAPPQGRPDDVPPQGRPGGQFTQETPYSTRYFVLQYDAEGNLQQADLSSIAAVTEDDTEAFLTLAQKHGEGFGYTEGYRYCVVKNGKDRYMAIFLDCSREQRTVTTVAVLSLIAMAVCLLLVYGLVVLCSRRAIEPVVQASERQKQFITDASHELKTPITVISTSLKLLEMETGPQKWIDKARSQADKLTRLVNELVTLSRLDEDTSPLTMVPFNISEAVRSAAEPFVDLAAAGGHELCLLVAPGLSYKGDEAAVRQLVSILLDNAVKYAAAGTPVTVTLCAAHKGVVISTENESGQHLSIEELPRLFDRFYRADPARTAGTGGFGIGLSIARSIAQGHRGTVRAESADGRHIRFSAELK